MKGYYIGMDGGGTGTTILVSSGGERSVPYRGGRPELQQLWAGGSHKNPGACGGGTEGKRI